MDETQASAKGSKVPAEGDMTDLLTCVLTRGIPVDGVMIDTLTHVCKPGETVEDVMTWADKECAGAAWLIKLEITKAT